MQIPNLIWAISTFKTVVVWLISIPLLLLSTQWVEGPSIWLFILFAGAWCVSTVAAIADYLTSRFADSATKAGTGEVSLSGARSWFSKNNELLNQYPELREERAGAIRNQESAEQLAQRVSRRINTIRIGLTRQTKLGTRRQTVKHILIAPKRLPR